PPADRRALKLGFDTRRATSTLHRMASDLHLHGVWLPLITPFDKSGSVDVEAIERLCGEYLADGVAGIVALGTTGEAPALDADEKQAVIDACSRACAARGARLIVGTGTNNTRSTIAATRAIEGVAAVVAAPAGFGLLSGDEAFAFPTVCMGGVGAIAAASHLCTARFVAMVECALAGKLDDGRVHAEALLPMIQAGFSEPNPAVFKGVLH